MGIDSFAITIDLHDLLDRHKVDVSPFKNRSSLITFTASKKQIYEETAQLYILASTALRYRLFKKGHCFAGLRKTVSYSQGTPLATWSLTANFLPCCLSHSLYIFSWIRLKLTELAMLTVSWTLAGLKWRSRCVGRVDNVAVDLVTGYCRPLHTLA